MTIVLVTKIRKYLKVMLDYCFIIHLSWPNCMLKPTFCTGVCTCIYCALTHGMALLNSRRIPWDEDRGSGEETFMPDVKIPLEGTWSALHKPQRKWRHVDVCTQWQMFSFHQFEFNLQDYAMKYPHNSITVYGLSFEWSTSDSSAISL